jgi:hypothetical protein
MLLNLVSVWVVSNFLLSFSLKVYAWEESFVEKLSGLRETELSFVYKSGILKAASATVRCVFSNFEVLSLFMGVS